MEWEEVAGQVTAVVPVWDRWGVDDGHPVAALRAACQQQGVQIREDTGVTAIQTGPDRADIETSDERISAQVVLLAAGAWSSSIPVTSNGEAVRLPRTTPVKGHLISYDCEPGMLAPLLRQGHTYLLQRQNGVLIAGSNEERSGFDRSIDQTQADRIAANAARLLPVLAGMRPSQAWVGFRPAVRKGTFPVGRWVGGSLCLAYGHYRNGILMAPSTASRLVEAIGQRVMPKDAIPAMRGV